LHVARHRTVAEGLDDVTLITPPKFAQWVLRKMLPGDARDMKRGAR
jgi:hypothetical protein